MEAAVEAGDLDPDRLLSFHKLEREAARFSRARHEQRAEDKQFGRMIKKVLKAKKDRR